MDVSNLTSDVRVLYSTPDPDSGAEYSTPPWHVNVTLVSATMPFGAECYLLFAHFTTTKEGGPMGHLYRVGGLIQVSTARRFAMRGPRQDNDAIAIRTAVQVEADLLKAFAELAAQPLASAADLYVAQMTLQRAFRTLGDEIDSVSTAPLNEAIFELADAEVSP